MRPKEMSPEEVAKFEKAQEREDEEVKNAGFIPNFDGS